MVKFQNNNNPPLFLNQNTGISMMRNELQNMDEPKDHDLDELIDSIADDKMPLTLKTVITVIAALEICTALVGNMYVIAMATFFKGRRSLTSPGQGSLIATLVVTLAINDLVMAITNVTMVVTIAVNESQWIFGETLCKLRDPFIQALVGVSCSLMVAIAWLRLRFITNTDARRRSMSGSRSGQKNIRQAFLIFIVIAMFYLVLSIPAILKRKVNKYILQLPVFNSFKMNETEFRGLFVRNRSFWKFCFCFSFCFRLHHRSYLRDRVGRTCPLSTLLNHSIRRTCCISTDSYVGSTPTGH